MSWGTESDSQSQLNFGNESQFKQTITRIESCLKNIKKQYDDLKARFDGIKNTQNDIKDIEIKRQNLSPMITETSDYIAKLERMVPTSHGTATTAMKNKVKEVRRRAAEITGLVQQLCAAINTELYNRQLTRKKESSIISQNLDHDENQSDHKNQMQMSVLEESQLKMAIEEQKQSEKIARDMITLENIFVQLSTMVHEQGEVIDRIEEHVEDAYVNTEAGVQDLGKAVIYKRSAMKKKICIIGIVLAVVVVIILIIVLSVVLNK